MTSSPPLLLTRDGPLESALQRLAAAAGSGLVVTGDLGEALGRWTPAPVVLVGPDCVADLAATAPVRRDRVHVVGLGRLGDDLFRAALAVGAESVLELPAAEGWLVETLTDTADGAVRRAVTVGVLGGSGGAGATTFAAALAATAASVVRPVTLVDADPLGAGVDRVVGFEDSPGARWDDLLASAGRFGSRSLRAALPERDGLALLGWGAGARAQLDPVVVREVVSASRRGSDLVVLDLPRYATPATAEALVRCDHVVVVCGLTLPAVGACGRVLSSVAPLAGRPHLVARGPVHGLDPSAVARSLGVPLRAVMGDQRRLDEDVDLGLGPVRSRRGPLARAARAVLSHLEAVAP
jgi:secretion/DNA translocation related CpaE-like protein